MQRRRFVQALAATALASGLASRAQAARQLPDVTVWKSPSCGCCGDWVAHMQSQGFRVKVIETDALAQARARLHMPGKYASCHTAEVGGYTLEGHVPATDVRRLLKDRPQAVGLAVPGMPVGSPGMDGEVYGGRKDPFDVLLVKRDGSASVFQSHR